MRVKVGGKDYDLRVSVLPTVHGEKIVLRVLDKTNLSASIDKLGLDPDTFKQVKNAIDAPHGLILGFADPGGTLERLDPSLLEAAADLGARPGVNIVSRPVSFAERVTI